jgi:hypothetical protein
MSQPTVHDFWSVQTMPRVSIPTGLTGDDGREERLSEYLCDRPGCPNIAIHVVGVVRELNMGFAVCAEHAALITRGGEKPSS